YTHGTQSWPLLSIERSRFGNYTCDRSQAGTGDFLSAHAEYVGSDLIPIGGLPGDAVQVPTFVANRLSVSGAIRCTGQHHLPSDDQHLPGKCNNCSIVADLPALAPPKCSQVSIVETSQRQGCFNHVSPQQTVAVLADSPVICRFTRLVYGGVQSSIARNLLRTLKPPWVSYVRPYGGRSNRPQPRHREQ